MGKLLSTKFVYIHAFAFYRPVYDENCTVVGSQTDLMPTDLRLNRVYIITYVNWVWTVATVILPFTVLVILSLRIFYGLKRVKRNLNR